MLGEFTTANTFASDGGLTDGGRLDRPTNASLALVDQVFIDSDDGLFGSDPELIFGIGSVSPGNIISLAFWDPELPAGVGYAAIIFAGGVGHTIQAAGVPSGYDLGTDSSYVFANWSEGAAPVPVPAALPLMVLGLGGLSILRRRKLES